MAKARSLSYSQTPQSVTVSAAIPPPGHILVLGSVGCMSEEPKTGNKEMQLPCPGLPEH